MGRVYQKGKIWYIDTSYNGKRIRVAVGKNKKLAITILKKTEIELIENKYLDIKKNKKIKFSEYFLKTYSKVNKKSWDRNQLIISNLNKFVGNTFLRVETGIKTSTLNRELTCLSTMLYKAIELGYLRETLPKIKLFKENNQKENVNFGKNTVQVNFDKNKKIVKTINGQRIGGVA